MMLYLTPMTAILRWDEEEDCIRDNTTPATPLSYMQYSIANESSHARHQIEGLYEEMALLKLLVQQLQLPKQQQPEQDRELSGNQRE